MSIAPPIYVFWDVTGKCNLNCIHCRELSSFSKSELSFDEAKKLIDQLSAFNVEFLGLLGGEPLLRSDIFEIIRYAKKKSLAVGLGTNGTLITEDIVKKLNSIDLNLCFVSVDGLEEINDNIRGKGAFKKAINGIKWLKKYSVPTGLRMTLMQSNISDWKGVVDLAIDFDLELSIRRVLPCGRASKNAVDLQPNQYRDAIVKIYDYAKKMNIKIDSLKSEGTIMLRNRDPVTFLITGIADEIEKKYGTKNVIAGCAAGIANCYLDSVGNVYACASLPLSVGNIRNSDFENLWVNSKLFNELRSRNLKGECGLCEYVYLCGGCRASAYFSHGDYLESDPFCMKKGEKMFNRNT